ncbi:DUF1398 domain-containing protein [Ktedonosporobacter rubrisoli]|uniref:DUF1398 domain-containing protein n=1 Tax=Ktedonosporobacter rubrisoli TaxID=2509675 RepID=A0A4P6JLR4_KTERU|nr:DUF1398 family protein [Ktedonosporobacter rubrisoli]QBD76023.1 DUF1398 domain-containing protein [Ktedonosporobacter rubrisoli]
MFTLEQINAIHDRLGTMEGFPQYVRALHALGIEKYDSYLTDGHSEYFGKGGQKLASPAVHETLAISDTSDREKVLAHLDLHGQRKTSYLEMSRGLAESGVEKWTVDTHNMTLAYYDKQGNELLIEQIVSR